MYYGALENKYDYIVYVPRANKTFRVRDFINNVKVNDVFWPSTDWTCELGASWRVNDTIQNYDGLEPGEHYPPGEIHCHVKLKK